MNRIEALRNDLKNRIRVLSRGLLPPAIDGKAVARMVTPGVGAGPQGMTFHVLSSEDQRPRGMISAPTVAHEHHLARYALSTRLGEVPGSIVTEDGVILKSLSVPPFFQKTLSDGTPLYANPIGKTHCYNTLASVMGFGCRHFDNQQPCQYCETSSVGRDMLGFPTKQDFDRFAESLGIFDEHGAIRSITITSGTFAEPDEVVRQYIELLTRIKRVTNKTVHVQFEPIGDLGLFKELSALADSVGIFLEVFNEDKRREVCPGKARIPKQQYLRNWEAAVKHFGKGNVVTTCLLGFGVDHEEILRNVECLAGMGVRTSLLFLRCKSKQLAGYVPSYFDKTEAQLLDLHLEAARQLVKHGVGFRVREGSGCIGCQGCTVMNEACRLVEWTAPGEGQAR